MNWDTFWGAINAFFSDGPEPWSTLVSVVGIVVGALVLRWLLTFVIRRVVQQIVSGVKKNQKVEDTQSLLVSPLAAVRIVQRSRTLGSVLANIVNVFILITSMLLIVTTINANILGSFALLTAAIGAGLGFGAQNIVKDILNGLFMVVEDQLGVGDIVDVGFASGVVETVGIRITQIRDVDGTLWFVRNGEILRVGNMSQGWARVIIDLAIPYSSNVEAIQAELLRVATALASSRKWRAVILERPEVWGLESISAEALVTRLAVKTRVSAKWDFARDLRLHMKKALDGMGVSLTPLNSVVMTGAEAAAAEDAALETEKIDAAEAAAAAVPDATNSGRTAPVPVRRVPRAARKLKDAPAAETESESKPKPDTSKAATTPPASVRRADPNAVTLALPHAVPYASSKANPLYEAKPRPKADTGSVPKTPTGGVKKPTTGASTGSEATPAAKRATGSTAKTATGSTAKTDPNATAKPATGAAAQADTSTDSKPTTGPVDKPTTASVAKARTAPVPKAAPPSATNMPDSKDDHDE